MNLLKKEIKKRASGETIYHFFSPGRINLIGEHIDYVGGLVVPAAINLGIEAYACKSNNIEINSINFQWGWVIDNNPFEEKIYDVKNDFMNYVYGSIKELKKYLKKTQGFKLILKSNIPIGSGLSSSAAFGMLIIEIFCFLYNIKINNIQKAKIFRRVENNFIGIKSGIMDQFAIQFGIKNHFIVLNTDTLKYQYIKCNLLDYKFILISSNKQRSLVSTKYNERVNELTKISILLNHAFEKLSEIKDLDVLKKIKPSNLKRRIRHVITENMRVEKIVKGLLQMTGKELGLILNESHQSLSNDYEVSCQELDFIHDNLTKIDNIYGSRMIGAGFGGCVLAVVSNDFKLNDINFGNEYFDKFHINFKYYEFNIDDGIRRLND